MNTEANLAISRFRTSRQSELDAAATAARAAHYEALRASLTDLPPDSPEAERLTCTAVAAQISIGRESDNFPIVDLAASVKDLIKRAYAAGVLPGGVDYGISVGQIVFFEDLSGVVSGDQGYHDDYQAWVAAKDYRSSE